MEDDNVKIAIQQEKIKDLLAANEKLKADNKALNLVLLTEQKRTTSLLHFLENDNRVIEIIKNKESGNDTDEDELLNLIIKLHSDTKKARLNQFKLNQRLKMHIDSGMKFTVIDNKLPNSIKEQVTVNPSLPIQCSEPPDLIATCQLKVNPSLSTGICPICKKIFPTVTKEEQLIYERHVDNHLNFD